MPKAMQFNGKFNKHKKGKNYESSIVSWWIWL